MDPIIEPAVERRSNRMQKSAAIESGDDSDDDPLSVGSRTSIHTDHDPLGNLADASSNDDQSSYYEEGDSDVESTDDEDDDLFMDPEVGIALEKLGLEPGELSDFSDDEECNETTSDEEDIDEIIVASVNSGTKRAVRGRGGERKRRRISKPPLSFVAETAATWLAKCNDMHPVDEDDCEMADFEALFLTIVRELCKWSMETEELSLADWSSAPREDRAMATYFRYMLMSTDPVELAETMLKGIPRITRKVLGRINLRPSDLMQLPAVPRDLQHRGVYLDILTRLPRELIDRRSYDGSHRIEKFARGGVDPADVTQWKVYCGSSLRVQGVGCRIREHIKFNNPTEQTQQLLDRLSAGATLSVDESKNIVPWLSAHYSFGAQRDIVPHFRVAGIFANPSNPVEEMSQDLERAMPYALEGIMMVYLNLYNSTNATKIDKWAPPASLELVARVRRNTVALEGPLHDFTDLSLNRAWPLVQGVPGGYRRANRCANPECDRVTKLEAINGYFSPRYCKGCREWMRDHNGAIRSVEGSTNGLFNHDNTSKYGQKINQKWFAAGNARRCYNESCGIEIPEGATVFGLQRGIRCARCHDWRRTFYEEYRRPGPHKDIDPSVLTCSECDKVGWVEWTESITQKLPNGFRPWEPLCRKCYTKRCCFEFSVGLDMARGKTQLACGRADCYWTPCGRVVLMDLMPYKDQELWMCMACDWANVAFGSRFPDAAKRDEAGEAWTMAPGPVQGRNNNTCCKSCGYFATWHRWHPNPDEDAGGFICERCFGRRCQNKSCYIFHTACSKIVNYKGIASFCTRCCNVAHKRGYDDETMPYTGDEIEFPDIRAGVQSESRYNNHITCSNQGCTSRIDDGETGFVQSSDKKFRCEACHHVWKRRGIDKKYTCGNPFCSDPIGYGIGDQAMFLEGDFFCRSCYMFWNANAKFRLEPLWCGNPHCGVPLESKDQKFEIMGVVFCRGCGMVWKNQAKMRFT